MVKILDRGPSLGGQLGAAFGTGLTSGIQNLAQLKLQQMQAQQQLAQQGPLFEAFGLPAQLAVADPRVQQLALRERLGQLGSFEQAQQQEDVLSLLGQRQQPKQEFDQSAVPLSAMERIGELPQTKNPDLADEKQQASQVSKPQEVKALVEKAAISPIPTIALPPAAKAEREKELLASALENPNLSASQKQKLRSEIDRREDKYLKQQEKVDKSTQKFYEEITDQASAAQETNAALNRLLELVNTGKVIGPVKAAVLETLEHGIFGIGLDLFGLTSPETQEFRKVSQQFLRNAKKIFGARITQGEVQQYMKSVPSLIQSDEGKRRVIRDMKIMNEGALLKDAALKSVIEEHGGYRPHNIKEQVDKRVKPQLDDLEKEFLKPYISPQQLAYEQQRTKFPLRTLGQDIASNLGF